MQLLHHQGVEKSSEVKRAFSTALWWRIKCPLMTTQQASVPAHTPRCDCNYYNELTVAGGNSRLLLFQKQSYAGMNHQDVLRGKNTLLKRFWFVAFSAFMLFWVTSGRWNESAVYTNSVGNKQWFPVGYFIRTQVRLGCWEMQGQSLRPWERGSAGCL